MSRLSPWYDFLGYQLVKTKSNWIDHRCTGKVLLALSRASMYRDEARRGVSVAAVPLACWEPKAAKTKSYPWQPTLAESQWSAGCERCRAVTWQTLISFQPLVADNECKFWIYCDSFWYEFHAWLPLYLRALGYSRYRILGLVRWESRAVKDCLW